MCDTKPCTNTAQCQEAAWEVVLIHFDSVRMLFYAPPRIAHKWTKLDTTDFRQILFRAKSKISFSLDIGMFHL